MADSDFDKFWEIATHSGVDDTFDMVPATSGVVPEDLASVLQSVNEMGSWLSHYLMNSITTGESKIPPSLYALLAVVQSMSREIVSQLSPCQCATCQPKDLL